MSYLSSAPCRCLRYSRASQTTQGAPAWVAGLNPDVLLPLFQPVKRQDPGQWLTCPNLSGAWKCPVCLQTDGRAAPQLSANYTAPAADSPSRADRWSASNCQWTDVHIVSVVTGISRRRLSRRWRRAMGLSLFISEERRGGTDGSLSHHWSW